MKVKPSSKNGGVLVELGPEECQLPYQPSPPDTPFKLRKILVPVDFSACSKKALQYAIPFAKQFGAELHLLYVDEPYPTNIDLAPMAVQTAVASREELEGLRLSIGNAVPSCAYVRTGLPHLVITKAAQDLAIDLIIIATHGRTGLKRMVLGSTAERVVRHAPCPVLIVREPERDFIVESSAPTANA